jgi:hypothetical protein
MRAAEDCVTMLTEVLGVEFGAPKFMNMSGGVMATFAARLTPSAVA